MSVLSNFGRNSDRKHKADSISSAYTTLSDIGQHPNLFHFWNEDEYNGQFGVQPEKQKIVKQGKGVYKTADGQTYEGDWENDCLVDNCKITYGDKSVFEGRLDEMMMEGRGRFSFKENIEVVGEFEGNNLLGKVGLIDPNRHLWEGNVKGDDFVDFYPAHPFWQALVNMPPKNYEVFYGEAEDEIWDKSF